MSVLVGLGNPGHTYHRTRHNVGFHVIERLAQRHGVRVDHAIQVEGRPAAVSADVRLGRTQVKLLMPLTMMNESGEALKGVEVALDRLLIICDDVHLPLGAVRLRAQGGAGGHHGLESCLAQLGTEQVARLRVGVGITPLPSDLSAFVLSPFTSAEHPIITHAVDQAADACETWITEGIEIAMNQCNQTQESS